MVSSRGVCMRGSPRTELITCCTKENIFFRNPWIQTVYKTDMQRTWRFNAKFKLIDVLFKQIEKFWERKKTILKRWGEVTLLLNLNQRICYAIFRKSKRFKTRRGRRSRQERWLKNSSLKNSWYSSVHFKNALLVVIYQHDFFLTQPCSILAFLA